MSWEPRLSPRQTIILEVVVEVDAAKAQQLAGTDGWMDASGDGEPPIPGIVLRADQLVWALAQRASEEWRESLDAVIVEANGHLGDIVDDSDSIL